MGVLFAVVIAAAVIAAVLGVDALFVVVWFLLGVLGLCWVWLRRWPRSLQIERQNVNHAFTGDGVDVAVTVRNTGRVPIPWMEMHEQIPLELRDTAFQPRVVALGAHAAHTFHYRLHCRRRGQYRLGPLMLESGDVFGLGHRTVSVPGGEEVIVYPRVVPLHHLGLPSRSALIVRPSRAALFEDPSRLAGVRDYAPGDSLRRMHWTASARSGHLVVKQFQTSVARETLVCLDGRPDHYRDRRGDAFEQAVVAAASIIHHTAGHEGLPAGLVLHDAVSGVDRVFKPHAERAHLMTMLGALARVDYSTTDPFGDLARRASADLPWGASVILVTGEIDPETAQSAQLLRRMGFAVAIVLIAPPGDTSGALGSMPVHRVWTDPDLAAWA